MSRELSVTTDRGAFQVRIDGDGGDWIVLSNGLATDMRLWDSQIEALSRGRRVLRYDTRGHGRSGPPALNSFSLDDLADDVVAIMDAMNIASADYAGISLGGITGLGVALRHPYRVRKLVCSNARGDATPSFVQNWDERIRDVEAGGLQSVVDFNVARWFTDNGGPTHRAFASDMMLATSREGYIGCARALQKLDYATQLGKLDVETLFISGSDDLAAPPDVMRAMARSTPRGRIVVIEGARHLPNVEMPATYSPIIAEFLGA